MTTTARNNPFLPSFLPSAKPSVPPPRTTQQKMAKAFILGLSGLSSSGKTTLARLLRSVFRPACFILHQDDFYRAEEALPVVLGGLRDWDCVAAIDFAALVRVLGHVHVHGSLPDGLESKEDQNAVGESGVSGQEVEDARRAVRQSGVQVNLAILEGFLLFHDDEVMDGLDARIFLRAPYEKVWGVSFFFYLVRGGIQATRLFF